FLVLSPAISFIFFSLIRLPPSSTLFPYTTLFRSFHFIEWTKTAFENVDVIPAGNGIMHQINLEKMSPVIQNRGGIAFPDTCVGTDSHTPHTDALGVISIGVGGLEAENVMLGRASWMRLPDIIGVELVGQRKSGI